MVNALVSPGKTISEIHHGEFFDALVLLHRGCPAEAVTLLATPPEDTGVHHATGATVTSDAPHRTTAAEIRLHRADRVQTVEMEAAALFALGRARHLPVASAVVIVGVANEQASGWSLDLPHAASQLHPLLLHATVQFLMTYT